MTIQAGLAHCPVAGDIPKAISVWQGIGLNSGAHLQLDRAFGVAECVDTMMPVRPTFTTPNTASLSVVSKTKYDCVVGKEPVFADAFGLFQTRDSGATLDTGKPPYATR